MERRPIVVHIADKIRENFLLWEGSDQAHWFRQGMIAMGCELEMHARLREDLVGVEVNDMIASTVAAALRATVQSLGSEFVTGVELTIERVVQEERKQHESQEGVQPSSKGRIT